jgi:hypothetical protein
VSAQLPRGAGKHLTGVIQASRTGYREMQSSVVVSNAVWDIPLIVMTGIRSTELGGMVGKISPTENTTAIRKICSEIIYKEDVDLVRQKEAQTIFQQSIEGPVELEDFVTSAQRAAVIYIDRALKTLADDDGTLQPHLVQYVKWLREKHILAKKGLLRGQDNTDAWLHMDAAADEEFLRSFEATCVDAKLLNSVGGNLSGILNGSVMPLDIMTKDGMLAKSYAEAHGVVTGVHMIKNWFDAKGHKQPDMKVLEVGAGTGSITLPILQTLKPHPETTPRFSSYVFTDISPGFFESAGELLKDWEGYVEFKRLDIEKCPLQQGFELGSFDVIAASNVSSNSEHLCIG